MAQTALWPLQVALFGRLDATGIKVYDAVSSTAEKPYIRIGEPTITAHATKTSYGENIVLPVHVWSDYNGKKECYDIFNLILEALKEPLIVEGSFFMLNRELVSMNVVYDPVEEGTAHGIMEMRFIINN